MCASRVHGFHVITADLPDGPVRGWVRQIGEQLDAELAGAHELAELGHALEPNVDRRAPDDPAARELWNRLDAAVGAFGAVEQQAVRIRLATVTGPDLVAVRAHLDVLADQLQQLLAP